MRQSSLRSRLGQISLTLVLAGATCIAISAAIENGPESTRVIAWFRILLAEIGSIASVAGTLALVFEVHLKQVFFEEIVANGKTIDQLRRSGLVGYGHYQEVDWQSLFATAKELDVMVTYAQTWRHGQQHLVDAMLAERKGRLRVFVADPANDELMEQLARRFGTTAEDISTKARAAISDLGAIARNFPEQVELYLFRMPPLFTFYRFDTTAVLVLYKHERARGRVPAFSVVRGGELYMFIERELDALLRGDKPLAYRYTFPRPTTLPSETL